MLSNIHLCYIQVVKKCSNRKSDSVIQRKSCLVVGEGFDKYWQVFSHWSSTVKRLSRQTSMSKICWYLSNPSPTGTTSVDWHDQPYVDQHSIHNSATYWPSVGQMLTNIWLICIGRQSVECWLNVSWVLIEMSADMSVSQVLVEKVRKSLHMSQVAHQARASSGFSGMKWLGVFLLSPGWDAGPSQGYPQH